MKRLLDLLHSGEWLGVSNAVEIAKGKNELVDNWIDTKRKIKRSWQKKG